MSWTEIKKAINSNISKTLDTLIIEKFSDMLSKINSISNIVTVAGNIKAVKSIQRGTISVRNSGEIPVTISSINPDKSIVLLSGNTIGSYYEYVQPYIYSLSSDNITIAIDDYNEDEYSASNSIISWQVIEFY